MRPPEALNIAVEQAQYANYPDQELVLEAERQLSWTDKPSAGNPHAPFNELLLINGVLPVLVARLTGATLTPHPEISEEPLAYDRLVGETNGSVLPKVEERRRAVMAMRSKLSTMANKDLAATARFHMNASRKALAARSYDARLVQVILPEMIRRIAERQVD